METNPSLSKALKSIANRHSNDSQEQTSDQLLKMSSVHVFFAGKVWVFHFHQSHRSIITAAKQVSATQLETETMRTNVKCPSLPRASCDSRQVCQCECVPAQQLSILGTSAENTASAISCLGAVRLVHISNCSIPCSNSMVAPCTISQPFESACCNNAVRAGLYTTSMTIGWCKLRRLSGSVKFAAAGMVEIMTWVRRVEIQSSVEIGAHTASEIDCTDSSSVSISTDAP